MFNTVLQGAMISAGLIIAIGAQNAFVLQQGLARQHVLPVVLVCFLCDALLMSAGVLGLGSWINASRGATLGLALGGAAFLSWYGFKAMRSAWRGGERLNASPLQARRSLRSVVLATLAITLLNPHVYLDTVVLLGGIAGTLAVSEREPFLLGAVSVSGLWFFALGFGARILSPLFSRPRTWQMLDIVIALVMWWIAAGLFRFAVSRV